MLYEGRVFRPPSEAYSLIVQATIGCSHNKCHFCDMYKEKKFRIRKLDEIKDDLQDARFEYSHIRRIFIGDGDALIMKTDDLCEILDYIRSAFPECERVGIYGSPKSIVLKSPEELARLVASGLGIVYLGLESGNEPLLAKMNKGETAAQIVQAGIKAKAAGLQLSVTVISGLGGAEHWRDHAVDCGKALTAMKPQYIGLLTLMVEKGTPLADWRDAGEFTPLTPEEIALETLLMLENLDCEGSVFRANHASNYVALSGNLNADLPQMKAQLEAALADKACFKSEQARRF